MTNSNAKRGDRNARPTRYGFPKINKTGTKAITSKATTPAKAAAKPSPYKATGKWAKGAKTSATSYPKYTPKKSTFKPVSDEVTVYGAKKFRTPWKADEFTGTKGSKIPAYVFDIDGTLQTHGSGASKSVLDWAAAMVKKTPDAVFLVITARDHGSFGYDTSFNWLMHHFPYPFIGPFARAKDDPRYASEFKRELAQGFEDIGLYQILGAADDNEFVIDMWKQWAKDHFAKPEEFEVLECSYGDYGKWRSDLPSKKGGNTYGTNTYPGYYDDGYGYGAYGTNAAKNRPAGTTTYPNWGKDPVDGKHKLVSEFIKEETGRDIANSPSWKEYFAKREESGAYLSNDVSRWDEVISEIEGEGYSVHRNDLLEIVRHDYPGYTEKELAEMTDEDLREHAGLFTSLDRDDEDVPLFSDAALGLSDPVHPSAQDLKLRAARIAYRLDLEEDAYATFNGLSQAEAASFDLVELEYLMEEATKLLGRTGVTPKELDTELDKLLEGVLDARRDAARDIAEETGALDVAEVLSELEEGNLSIVNGHIVEVTDVNLPE